MREIVVMVNSVIVFKTDSEKCGDLEISGGSVFNLNKDKLVKKPVKIEFENKSEEHRLFSTIKKLNLSEHSINVLIRNRGGVGMKSNLCNIAYLCTCRYESNCTYYQKSENGTWCEYNIDGNCDNKKSCMNALKEEYDARLEVGDIQK